MTREEAKELLPIIQAFAEGKTIQYEASDGWIDLDALYPHSDILSKYRIKPEPKYRPFKNQEECWEEMLKHNEFGWVKSKTHDANKHVSNIEKDIEGNVWFVTASFSGIEKYSPKQMLDYFVFTDGEPFGVKEEQKYNSEISNMKISEIINKLQEIQKEHSCELDAINSIGDEIVEVRWLAFSSSVVFMTDSDL